MREDRAVLPGVFDARSSGLHALNSQHHCWRWASRSRSWRSASRSSCWRSASRSRCWRSASRSRSWRCVRSPSLATPIQQRLSSNISHTSCRVASYSDGLFTESASTALGTTRPQRVVHRPAWIQLSRVRSPSLDQPATHNSQPVYLCFSILPSSWGDTHIPLSRRLKNFTLKSSAFIRFKSRYYCLRWGRLNKSTTS
jgi:hypothetical protein